MHFKLWRCCVNHTLCCHLPNVCTVASQLPIRVNYCSVVTVYSQASTFDKAVVISAARARCIVTKKLPQDISSILYLSKNCFGTIPRYIFQGFSTPEMAPKISMVTWVSEIRWKPCAGSTSTLTVSGATKTMCRYLGRVQVSPAYVQLSTRVIKTGWNVSQNVSALLVGNIRRFIPVTILV